jgi:REP element-mobilizing transposase RayT
VFVEGGLYHVYNRFASGEGVFSDLEEAKAFVDLFRWVKRRDGWTVLAWCLMSNHYHFAIRSRAVPISHGLHCLQGRFSQRYNRSPDRVSHIVGEGIKRRVDDEVFSSQVDRLDAELAQLVQGGVVNAHNDQ